MLLLPPPPPPLLLLLLLRLLVLVLTNVSAVQTSVCVCVRLCARRTCAFVCVQKGEPRRAPHRDRHFQLR